jgi:predicted ferric reductase
MKVMDVAKLFLPAAAVASPAVPLSLYFAGNWYSFFHSYSLGMAFGLASWAYFLNTLLLAGRIRLFDRLFGHDRVLVFHGYMASAALALAAAHLFFKYYYSFALGLQTLLGAAALALFAAVIAGTALFMVDGVLARLAPVRRLRERAARTLRTDYSALKLFHNFTAISTLLVAVHVLLAFSTRERSLRSLVMASWAGSVLAVYLYHKVFRLLVTRARALTVREILRPADGVVELRMENARRALRRRKAGQFAYFRVLSKTCGIEEHPFTIASPPGENDVSIVVKNLGDYTRRLGDVEPGTKVLSDGPYGIFTPRREEPPHVFVAGGIGITPFLSIVADWDIAGLAGPLTLFWSVRLKTDLVHGELFEGVSRRHPQFSFVPVFSREGGVRRRIDADMLSQAIPQSERRRVSVYLCGPDAFRAALTERLIRIGVPRRRVHFERFSA